MESKHTPGPWAAESVLSSGYLGLRVIDEGDSREVARVPIMEHASTPDFDRDGIEEAPVRFPREKSHTYTTEHEAETIRANAALIAAAPDMYEVLAELLSTREPNDEQWASAHRALTKAEGR